MVCHNYTDYHNGTNLCRLHDILVRQLVIGVVEGPNRFKILTVAMTFMLCLSGYFQMMAKGIASVDHDLVVSDMPVGFDNGKTMRIDTQTNYRSFVIYNDCLRIRSQYLTYWDFNETYEHEDVCYVIGEYVYAYVPPENLTLNSITEINRFQLSSWNGTVSVHSSQYSINRMTLIVNATTNASLLIRPVGLEFASRYRVLVDDEEVTSCVVNMAGYFEYNYTGVWSNHTITLLYSGSLVIVPSTYLNIIYIFLTLGVFITVAKAMILPMRQKKLTPHQVQRTLVRAGIYIVVASTLLITMTNMFIGG